jgi:glycosyltransferase involved in cell wall biosynthesis
MTETIRYVPRSMRQHGAHSGYDQLFRHMGLPPAASAWGQRLADAIPGGLAWRLWHLRAQATAGAGLKAELGAMPWLAGGSGRLCHFIYGEDTYFLTPLWQRKGNRSIATFHYPPQRLALRVNPGSVRMLHAALMVGENQREYLRQLLPDERIHYCPHAVDTDFFCPDPVPPAAQVPRLVCAGMTFRDYGQLRTVHRALRNRFCVETDVIGASPEQLAQIGAEEGIVVHNGVSDESLRALYRAATVGVLPLSDATANNALLELMACGRAVVVSDVGGVRDYVQGSAVQLTPAGDSDALIEAAARFLEDEMTRETGARLNREAAVTRLGFEPVAARMRDIYRVCQVAD